MNPTIFSGWVQLATGLLALAFQGYQLYHGQTIDPSHMVIGAGLTASGVGHMANGRH